MVINKGKQRNLHWHTEANEWHYYLRGKGRSRCSDRADGGKIADVGPGDAVYIPRGFSATPSRITGDEDLETVQTWDKGKFEEIDLDRWVRSSPNYLLTNNFSRGVDIDDRQNEGKLDHPVEL